MVKINSKKKEMKLRLENKEIKNEMLKENAEKMKCSYEKYLRKHKHLENELEK